MISIQDRLFTIGSLLAEDVSKNKMTLPKLNESDISDLEKAIDNMDEKLEPMKQFVLPGGHISVSHIHVARCICRRAERRVLHLNENQEVNSIIIKYINRLSDYLFTLSRFVSKELGAKETPWIPKK
ncbi:MAG: cob(I)yrinic acid a,c-diamide adenosyltransferase [Bacteroidia bacterium]